MNKEPKPCEPNEHVPDITGICKVCGWEVVREVDSDGDPIKDDEEDAELG